MAVARLCLIVDHPLRDLDGLVLLGTHLAQAGADVFLVPMYHKHEVFLLRPDVVLVNYVRYANAEFIMSCRAAGISVAVLDTEGGIRSDFEEWAQQVRPHMSAVDLYCVWGRTQFEVMKRAAQDTSCQVVATGCPRYDFAVEPWSGALPHVEIADPMVLVNMNFPIINSGFQTVEGEIRELMRVGHTESSARERVRQSHIAQERMVDLTRTLANDQPSAFFVVRPHPFEDAQCYRDSFAGFSNVCVEQHGSVFPWLSRASVLVHHNCSTAIEAVMMGREPVMPAWIPAPALEQPATIAVSRLADSPARASALVAELLDGQHPERSRELDLRRENTIEQFFLARDGRASERVAARLLDLVAARRRPDEGVLAYGANAIVRVGGWRGRLQRGAVLALGSSGYARLRRAAGAASLPGAKQFGPGDVDSIVQRIRRVMTGLTVEVRRADAQDTVRRKLDTLQSVALLGRRCDVERAA